MSNKIQYSKLHAIPLLSLIIGFLISGCVEIEVGPDQAEQISTPSAPLKKLDLNPNAPLVDILPFAEHISYQNKVFELPKGNTLEKEALQMLPVDEGIFLSTHSTAPENSDTTIIWISYPVSKKWITEDANQPLQFSQHRLRLLKQLQPSENTTLLAVFTFFDQLRSNYGTRMNIIWNVREEKPIANSVTEQQPSSVSNIMEQRLENYKLENNYMLNLEFDSIILLTHIVRDIKKINNAGDPGLNDRRESLRLIYELLGSEVKNYDGIVEYVTGPDKKQTSLPAIDFQTNGLQKNPRIWMPQYRKAFPHRRLHCLICD
ncbi:hypothetical protein WJU16_03140 [Chitinophaga pollutisoli]|uniref:Lipoprotein n=1 Tax=Chitinophaga pollutisoli TaxID=3133966 RepID=A0ABZ2YQG4_9BACT